MQNLIEIARTITQQMPEVKALLSDRVRFLLYVPAEYKTAEYMERQISGLVTSLYNNLIGGEFIDIMANVISGQLTQAFTQAYYDEGFIMKPLPDYLDEALAAMIAGQYMFVDQYFRDIIDARIDGTPIEPLLSRAQLWANRWNEAYNDALKLIALNNGGKMVWIEGDTVDKCHVCKSLDGIVAFAKEWETLGVKPQHAPNEMLNCGGWKCQCELKPTDKRRSPNAYGRIEEILLSR